MDSQSDFGSESRSTLNPHQLLSNVTGALALSPWLDGLCGQQRNCFAELCFQLSKNISEIKSVYHQAHTA